MKNKIIYLIVGLLVLGGFVITSPKTIDKETVSLIERSLELNTEDMWEGFDLEDYPVDVYYGKIEYRYEDGNIEGQEPSYPVPALTAYPDIDGPVIKVLPLKEVRNIIDDGSMDLKEREDVYISVLAHEGFHCYQIANGADIGIEPGKGYDFNSDIQKEIEKFDKISYELNENKIYEELCKKEMIDLIEYYETGNGKSWLESREERIAFEREFLGENFDFYDDYTYRSELLEGTAKYIELETIRALRGEEPEFKEEYIKGDYRFYITGALKSYIIEEAGELYNIDFTDTRSLERLVIENI